MSVISRCEEDINVHAYLAKLPEQLYEGALTKGVGQAGMKGESGILWGQHRYPTFLIPNEHRKSGLHTPVLN